MADKPIAQIIDELLAARKTLSGNPDWQASEHGVEYHVIMPLRINGLSTGADLRVTAYPNEGHSRYRILLCAPKCIWRIDHVVGEPHVNSFNRPTDLKEYSFDEPHYHSWNDNRRFCTHASLPDRLENARILPPNHRAFDNALRWFCGSNNIEQPPHGLIVLPQRTRLL